MNISFNTSTLSPVPPRQSEGRSFVEGQAPPVRLRAGRARWGGGQSGVFGPPDVLATLGCAGLVIAALLALMAVTADSVRMAGNSLEIQHHRRITQFNEAVRAAAAHLEHDRTQCLALKSQPRRTCQQEALHESRVALQIARERYEDSSALAQSAQP